MDKVHYCERFIELLIDLEVSYIYSHSHLDNLTHFCFSSFLVFAYVSLKIYSLTADQSHKNQSSFTDEA